MQWQTAVDPTRKYRNYEESPYWFAWYPVVAKSEDGSFRRIWREYVRQERHARMVGDGYGGICKDIYYLYFALRPEQMPEREPFGWKWFLLGALVPFIAVWAYAIRAAGQ